MGNAIASHAWLVSFIRERRACLVVEFEVCMPGVALMRDAGNKAVVCVVLHVGAMGYASPPVDGIVVLIRKESRTKVEQGRENIAVRTEEGAEAEHRIAYR